MNSAKIQKNAQERIRWVFRFADAGMDIDKLRPGDWLNLRDDMRLFLHGLSSGKYEALKASFGKEEEEVQHLTPESLKTVQQKARNVLQRIARRNTEHGTNPPDGLLMGLDLTGRVEQVFLEITRPGPLRLFVIADNLWDEFAFALGAALCSIDVTYIRACRLCLQVFLAGDGRQCFCSKKCNAKTASRRYRESHGEELRIKAHKHYEKKLKKKTGRPLQKVGQFRKVKTVREKS